MKLTKVVLKKTSQEVIILDTFTLWRKGKVKFRSETPPKNSKEYIKQIYHKIVIKETKSLQTVTSDALQIIEK